MIEDEKPAVIEEKIKLSKSKKRKLRMIKKKHFKMIRDTHNKSKKQSSYLTMEEIETINAKLKRIKER